MSLPAKVFLPGKKGSGPQRSLKQRGASALIANGLKGMVLSFCLVLFWQNCTLCQKLACVGAGSLLSVSLLFREK